MELRATEIADVKVLQPERFRDARGFFSEAYNARELARFGINDAFVQENQLFSAAVGTVRGLHFQLPPMAQAKLVRVVRGRIADVAVDLRANSPTFGHHVIVELSATEGNQLYVPKGFAHGLMTLEPDTEVLYRVDAYWSPEHERGLYYADPDLSISWPETGVQPVLSARDTSSNLLRDLPVVEVWEF